MTRCRPWARVLLLGLARTTWAATALAAPPKAELGPSILHVPVKEHEAEQGILTPIPVSIDLPPELGAARVLLHYRTFGADRWSSVELHRDDDRWSGEIPCLEVSTITGDVSYYIRVHDAEGSVVAYSGTRNAPYKVRIVHDTARTSATLERPRCPDPVDCPAGLLGCGSEPVEAIPCDSDHDCEGGMTCSWAGACELDRQDHTRLTLEGAQDFGFVETTGACSLTSQESRGYLCSRTSDGAQYYGVPTYSNEPIRAALGPTRLVAGLERAVGPNATVGLRVGLALRGAGPTAPGGVEFFPFLFEGRVTHWFGDDPFWPRTWRAFTFLSAGGAMFDFEMRTHVREDPRFGGRQPNNPLEQTLEVWKRAGDVYLGAGAGATVTLRPHLAVRGEVASSVVFPFGAVIVTPRAGMEVGF